MKFINKTSALISVACVVCAQAFAQNDSIPKTVEMEEIVISAKAGFSKNSQAKPAASVDEYLQSSEKVQMLKRGNYAWEPAINNMTTERISVTIDGMKIFCACTDRMDPVTSYVETSNLSKVNIGSGFGGDPQATGNIGGSMNLVLNKAGFGNNEWELRANTGYETNGRAKVYSADGSYSGKRFYANAGFSHRESGNYRAGGGEEISYSQYAKNNAFTNVGFLPEKGHIIEGTVIYDFAADVGYPALLMDVASAEGFIASLSYRREQLSDIFHKWETKAYYNHISHIMDDTKREEVINGAQMHMDMPGLSATGGLYSTLTGGGERHNFTANFDAYTNRSLAEMTMYPLDQANPPMFMLTWGDVRTFNSGLALSDEISLDRRNTLRFSTKLSWQRSGLHNKAGFKMLQTYYPEFDPYGDRFLWKQPNRVLWDLSGRYFASNRLLWNISLRYLYKNEAWELAGGGGYGSRAPSVSEGYGYFLYNTFDGYDYLGNPALKNEKSFEGNASVSWRNSSLNVKLDGSAFYFSDYIIGRLREDLWRMTMGAAGVKVYENLPHATIVNANLTVKYYFADYFQWRNRLSYAIGRDNGRNPLPLIAPLTMESTVSYRQNHFSAEINLQGAGRQTNFSPEYGEDLTPSYLTANLSVGYSFKIRRVITNLKAGVENIFDKHYSTWSDWNNIPRKGRNIFINWGLEI
jgi:iron complex outermembrane receptor protein